MKLSWRKTGAVLGITGALVLMMATFGFSQGPPPEGRFRGGPGPRDGLGPMARDLNLTDDQKAKIKQITDSFEASTKDLRDQLRSLRESGPDPLTSAFDEAAVRAAAQARAKVQIEQDVAHAQMISQIFGVLTAEQKAQLVAKRQEFEQRRPK